MRLLLKAEFLLSTAGDVCRPSDDPSSSRLLPLRWSSSACSPPSLSLLHGCPTESRCLLGNVTPGVPVDTARNSLSVMELTRQKLQVSLLYASPLRKTRRSCCVPVSLSTLPPEPVIPSKKPFKVELVGGKRYSWCTCGHSKKQPFCDGAHKTKAQGLMPLRFIPEKDCTVWLCGCKYTNNPPYCDGTHKQDFIVSAPLHEQTDS
ncbi:uncharacterized protein AB9X84_015886 [Acanthopagrus schlegelii]